MVMAVSSLTRIWQT